MRHAPRVADRPPTMMTVTTIAAAMMMIVWLVLKKWAKSVVVFSGSGSGAFSLGGSAEVGLGRNCSYGSGSSSAVLGMVLVNLLIC